MTISMERMGMRFLIAFGLCGMVLATMAVRLAQEATNFWWVVVAVEVYFSACLLSLAVIYGLREVGVIVEDYLVRPGRATVIRLILLPYLVLGGIGLYLARWFDREGLLNPVAPGLYIGRLPFPSELSRLRGVGIRAVVNLCWEFPRLSGIDGESGVEAANVPILDGSSPSDRQFEEAIHCVSRWRSEGRSVLVHCAQGHGRSSTIVAAALLRLGLALDLEQALFMVKTARPSAKPSRKQWAALHRYSSEPRTELTADIATDG